MLLFIVSEKSLSKDERILILITKQLICNFVAVIQKSLFIEEWVVFWEYICFFIIAFNAFNSGTESIRMLFSVEMYL